MKIYYQKTKAFFTIIIGAQKLKIKPNKLYYNIIKMTTFGDDIYCKTINGKAPSDHGTVNFATVLQNSTPEGNADGKNLASVGSIGCTGITVTTGATNVAALTASGALECTNTVVKFTALPTTEPTVVGELWNDNGTVKIHNGTS